MIAEKLTKNELSKLFNAIDLDGNGSISVNEFSLFVTGIVQDEQSRIVSLDRETESEIKIQARQMFNLFDLDSNGRLDATELRKTMQSLEQDITLDQAKLMIA
mmetsp:Transcript_39839/g.28779  ORF Transcript_39839/g.28779 Transcript_39839/m.28779 type:complete len:103 (+) Transcript_39839:388-696(+)|eukprot:CAMPEP_0116879378 /NCGR_PEP_ID=MMETSP0463-20121206/11183_1 /TAXON_ID=181622 /ORGANISM="Strombidinopsis sp, Strain SopsisLIS2011" /LENGTH=102 /DNA_ID=CAMNT_0004528649 /DNA_START=1072 /DNA_END=1380 /DNA_ORIENTATION=+